MTSNELERLRDAANMHAENAQALKRMGFNWKQADAKARQVMAKVREIEKRQRAK